MFAIMCGSPWSGYRFYGPFENSDEADIYQNNNLFMEDFWWIVELEKDNEKVVSQ